jgi:Icc-related predicted phosphoesterase
LRIVCLSDIHSKFDGLVVPDGDLLVVAGDLTGRGTPRELMQFNSWLYTLPHRHKVVIAGNHDFALERDPAARELLTAATYLQDRLVQIEGLRIYGSPWQPRFFDWAFNLDRGPAIRAKWDRIPAGLDLLVTHGPPHGVLDRTLRGQEVGCEELRLAVQRVRPRLHVFGHIHPGYGQLEQDGVHYVNASTCTQAYQPTNPPIVVEL